ncbi:MAG: YlbF family regulator [Lachnospiraceae bacterium]
MTVVESLTAQLAKAVLESDEYRNYLKCSEELKKDADLYRRVNDMRRRNFDIQNNADAGDVFEAAEELRKQYHELRELAGVKDFLTAEMSLGRMIQEIYRTVVRDISFDLDFLNN